MGTSGDSFLCGRRSLRDHDSRRSSEWRAVGVRPSVLPYSELGGRGKFAGKPGYVHGVSTADAGGLRPSVLAEMMCRLSKGGRGPGDDAGCNKSAIGGRFVYPAFFDVKRIGASSEHLPRLPDWRATWR